MRKIMLQQLKRIPFQLWVLGIADAFLNVSASMIFTISGPFMKEVLKSSSVAIGILEGVVELVSWSLRLISGIISDYFKNRKGVMVLGYFIIILSRPLLALSTGTWSTLGGRSLDRIGKGIQAAPRDAFVADISPSGSRGTYFGLRHSLGMVGSIIGSFAVFCFIKMTECNYRLIFWLSFIPALLAFLFLISTVQEKKKPETPNLKVSLNLKEILVLGKEYWIIILISVFFMLCRSSEIFITLRALELGMAIKVVPFIMITYHFAEIIISYPIGRLSDFIGRPLCIAIATIFLSGANFLIGNAKGNEAIFLGSLLWGMQRGIGNSVFLSWIADKALPNLRATAYGTFYLISGLSLFLANLITGIIANHEGYKTPYIGHALLGILPLMSLLLFIRKEKMKKKN